jgi:hypothetical protein
MKSGYNIFTVMVYGLLSSTIVAGAVPEYSRSKSVKLSVRDMAAISSNTDVIVNKKASACIVLPTDKDFLKAACTAVSGLEKQYRVKFKAAEENNLSQGVPGNYIVFSNGNDSYIALRLEGNGLITGNKYGHEVRNIPNAFGRNCNILYFGGKKPEDLIKGMRRFLKKQAVSGNNANLKVGKYIDLQTWNRRPKVKKDYSSQKIKGISDLYKSRKSQKNTKAIRLLSNVSHEYYNTGDEDIARTFVDMMRVFDKNYTGAKNWRKTPPSFRFPELVRAVDQIEEAESLSNEERVFLADVLRYVTEDCMNYWEMSKPMKLYNSGKVEFLTNHPLFASRGVNAASRYLLARYNIPAALYWKAVSSHAFKGIEQVPVGPEDAGSYQWLSRRIYTNFCINSGVKNYNTPNLQSYIDYALANINHLGVTAPYGDTTPMTDVHGWSFLRFGKMLNNDKLCEYVLQRMTVNPYVKKAIKKMQLNPDVKYTPRMLGLTVFIMNDFLKKYFGLKNKKPILNKAVFRNGYTPTSEYLMLGGLNTKQVHGHMDANAVIQYLNGNRFWLLDGDYIKAFPREHNSIAVSRDSNLPDQRLRSPYRRDAVAELDAYASAPNFQQAISVSTLRDHAGLDWTRNIFWTSKKGFWIIDNLKAVTSGRYVTKCYWRTLGNVELKDNTFKVTQKKSASSETPWHFFIARGDDANSIVTEAFDLGHSGPFGNFAPYKFASPVIKIITEQRDAKLKKGATLRYVNYFFAAPGENPNVPEIRKVGDLKAWIAGPDNIQLVAVGEFAHGNVVLNAEKILMDENNLCAVNASRIVLGGVEQKFEKPENVYIEFGKGRFKGFSTQMAKEFLEQIRRKTPAMPKLMKFSSINVPEFKAAENVTQPDIVSCLAAADGKILSGYPNGNICAYDSTGKKLWTVKLKAGIKALAPIKSGSKTYWAVGTDYDNRKSRKGYVAFINDSGKLLWQNAVHSYHERNGTIRTITGAKLKSGSKQQIVAGSEAWKYLAFDQKGRKLWEFPVLHAATVCASGDMTGNGIDEIAVGTEYPYHWIINNKGKKIKTVLSSPGDYSVLVADVINDNKKEAVWGREDGYVKIMRPGKKERRYVKDINVGGLPTGIVKLPGKNFAVATDCNTVVFVKDGIKGKIVYFPAGLCDLKRFKDKLYTVCMDGHLYKLDLQGKILAKHKMDGFRTQEFYKPLLASETKFLALTYNKKLIIFK